MEALFLIIKSLQISLRPPSRFFLLFFLSLCLVLLIWDFNTTNFEFKDLQVHFHAILIEVFFLSFLFSLYEKNQKKNSFLEEIEIIRPLQGPFACYRLAILIQRLNEINHTKFNLNNCFLKDAYLVKVHLVGSDLSYCNLSHADLSGADLRDTILLRADLTDAILSDVILAKRKAGDFVIDFEQYLSDNDVIGKETILKNYKLEERKVGSNYLTVIQEMG